LVALGVPARAADEGLALPPWSDGVLPRWAESVRVLDADEPILRTPQPEAKRRGAAARLSLLPLFGVERAPGCAGLWLLVGAQAWMCSERAELSGTPALAPGSMVVAPGDDGLPMRYYFAGPDGALAYRRMDEIDSGEPVMTLEPGFAVAVVHEVSVAGERYGRTHRALWVPMRDLGAVRPIALRGVELGAAEAPELAFAWVVVDGATVFRRSGALFVPTGERRARFERVAWHGDALALGGRFVRIDEGRWLRARDVRRPSAAPPPLAEEPAIEHGARWIDIELASQTLVAYEGLRPAFATLVSTGKGQRPGHPFETPRGLHRIWIKLVTSTMDNLEDEDAASYYRIEDVPWVQFFQKGVGLHAAFWHRSFGHVRSHGCVNLAPHDAAWLFRWTAPLLPAGWSAVLPSDHDPGTLVRVR
jgi:hypothetical protein